MACMTHRLIPDGHASVMRCTLEVITLKSTGNNLCSQLVKAQISRTVYSSVKGNFATALGRTLRHGTIQPVQLCCMQCSHNCVITQHKNTRGTNMTKEVMQHHKQALYTRCDLINFCLYQPYHLGGAWLTLYNIGIAIESTRLTHSQSIGGVPMRITKC